jgi:hypothetical protein
MSCDIVQYVKTLDSVKEDFQNEYCKQSLITQAEAGQQLIADKAVYKQAINIRGM